MTLWKSFMKIWEMLRDPSYDGEPGTAEIKEPTWVNLDLDEGDDKHFCIGNSDWCVL